MHATRHDQENQAQYCDVYDVWVTNNNEFWIRWIHLLDTHKS
jgi:hypothetical protein